MRLIYSAANTTSNNLWRVTMTDSGYLPAFLRDLWYRFSLVDHRACVELIARTPPRSPHAMDLETSNVERAGLHEASS